MEKFFLKKKSHNAKKTKREDPLGFFNIHSVAKLQKIERGPFREEFFFEKSRTVPKQSEGGTFWSRTVLYVTRETFLVQFLGPTGTFWGPLNFVELLVELFWSVQVVSKNTDKIHDYSRFLRKAPTKKASFHAQNKLK